MKNSRRDFIKLSTLGAFATMLGGVGCTSILSKPEKLTILHTNDVHSHIDPFPIENKEYGGKGGYARRSALIKKVRSEESNVLLFDSGDIFQGTPYFNFYHGALDIKLMNQMGYDAGTIGNHEFDNGTKMLAKQIKRAEFPFVCSNYKVKGSDLEGHTMPYKIFNKGNIRVGVIGLGIELKGLVTSNNYEGVEYLDPIKVSEKLGKYLKEEKRCNLIVALSHVGYDYYDNRISDRIIAANTSYIDVILGGHTHTFLEKPVTVKNKLNKDVVINQTGWGGINLGRLDFEFGNDENLVMSFSEQMS